MSNSNNGQNAEWDLVKYMKIDGLKYMCTKYGLESTGTQEDIFKRLEEHYKSASTSMGTPGVSYSTSWMVNR